LNLLRELNDESPRTYEYVRYHDLILEKLIDDGPYDNGWWKRYITALGDAWEECCDAAEE
jgi:hypothetical protein